MAFEYFLYRTDYNNTLVAKSDTSFFPLPPNTGEIFIDYFIPEIQPLYFYAESGGTIVINDQQTADAYYENEYPTTGDDYVLQSEYTGYTNTNDTRVTNVETAITSVDNKVSYVSGITSGNTVDISTNRVDIDNISGQTTGNTESIGLLTLVVAGKLDKTSFNNFTGTTLPTNYYNKTQINSYSATTLTNINSRLLTTDFNTFSGTTLPANYYNKTEINSYSATTLTNINSRLLTTDFNVYSAATEIQIESKIPKVSPATAGNLVVLAADGTLVDSDVSIDSITGGTGFYYYTETGVTLTNSTTTDVSFINATGLSLQAGTWSVDFTALGGNDSRNKTIDVGYYVDGNLQATIISFNTNAAANRISFPISIDLPLTAGDHVFEIRFNTPDGGTAVIDWGSIRAKLVK